MQTFSVIMAGGGGTRFWPISRQVNPKQLLNLSGNNALINETIDRISNLSAQPNIYIVTNQQQGEPLKEVVGDRCKQENILLEPAARNTAACIGYAAFKIMKKHGDGVMCVFPADHYIKDQESFTKVLQLAIQTAETENKLVTIGITPTFPSTGYGYINYNPADGTNGYFDVLDFVEKPNYENANQYLKSGQYLWNSGMFVWKVSTILKNFERFLPKLYNQLEELSNYLETPGEREKLQEIYPTLQSISVDYGIMERSDEVLVIPGSFGWNDVGSWDSLGAIFPMDEDGNIIRGENISIDTKNSVIYGSDKLITTIGLDNVVIADSGDAILVCAKDRSQDVKQIVDILKEKEKVEYL